MVTIGPIELRDKPLFLAPMEDVTDPAFRFVCKQYGADVMYTEFIASDGLIRDATKSIKKLDIFGYERPIGIQIYGHQPESMIKAATIAEAAGPDLIDLNFGCPVRKIAARGAGAGMLCNVPLMTEITSAIVKAVKLPVTVKTRLGWDETNKNIVDIAERLQDVGIKAITIHGRTRAQLYKGSADWELIGEVKKNPRMKIPVIGNGDIISPQGAEMAFKRYGVDGIMIGRGSVGRPWIFREIRHYLDTGDLLPDLTLREKVALAKAQLEKSIEWKGIPVGIYEMRRHLSNYFKGLPNFKEIRLKLVTCMDHGEINSILNSIIDKYQ